MIKQPYQRLNTISTTAGHLAFGCVLYAVGGLRAVYKDQGQKSLTPNLQLLFMMYLNQNPKPPVYHHLQTFRPLPTSCPYSPQNAETLVCHYLQTFRPFATPHGYSLPH